jgi:hypothetical protein
MTGERTGGDNGAVKQPWSDVDTAAADTFGLRPPSEEVRASLAAVQAARAAAQSRLQRDSRRVRIVTVACLMAFAAGGFAVVGHFQTSRRQAQAQARGAIAPAAIVASSLAAPAPTLPPAAQPALPAAGPTPVAVAPASAPAATSPVDTGLVDPETIAARDRALAACSDAYDRHRWRTAAETCGTAFEAQPHNAALAMKVAQAQHARNHYAEAGTWARRAIGLEDSDPEAFIILAHAERRAKNPVAARTAYRRYLALAPRGWHASEARAAVHLSRTEAVQ